MSLEIWLFLGVIACGALVWYLYQRSKNETPEDTAQQTDEADKLGDDEYEDLLLTGLMLSEVYDDDHDSSDDTGSDGSDSIDDGGGFDGGGFDGGGFDGGGTLE